MRPIYALWMDGGLFLWHLIIFNFCIIFAEDVQKSERKLGSANQNHEPKITLKKSSGAAQNVKAGSVSYKPQDIDEQVTRYSRKICIFWHSNSILVLGVISWCCQESFWCKRQSDGESNDIKISCSVFLDESFCCRSTTMLMSIANRQTMWRIVQASL